MPCEHFEEGRVARCRAVTGTLIPSHFERERYCTSDESVRCPTRRLYTLRRGPLPQQDYWALWVGQPDAPASM